MVFRWLSILCLAGVVMTAAPGRAGVFNGKTDVFASPETLSHVAGSAARYDARVGGYRLVDAPEGGYRSEGAITSDSLHYGFGFNTAVASWNADCPDGTWVKVEVQTSADDVNWSAWYEMATWGDRAIVDKMPKEGKVKQDALGKVNEDTLELKDKATRLRWRVTLHTDRPTETPVVTLVAMAVVDRSQELPSDNTTGPAWGKEIPAEYRSQLVENGDIAWRICGPTSTTMALTAHGISLPTAQVAQACWDSVNGIYGNWPFIAAAASSLMRAHADAIPSVPGQRKTFQSWVMWPAGWKAIENEIVNGNPCVVSINFSKGQLRGGPLNESDGHLILVRGFTKDGDVICNDPASHTEAGGRVIYKRSELDLARHTGPAIVLHPTT